MKTPSEFYRKLTSQRHIGLDGKETFSTHPHPHGLIICRRPGIPDQRVILYSEPNGRMTIENLDAKKVRKTFRNAGNTCAEEWHKEIELISLPVSQVMA